MDEIERILRTDLKIANIKIRRLESENERLRNEKNALVKSNMDLQQALMK